MKNERSKTPVDILLEKGYSDVIVFSNPDYTTALVGITPDGNAVYDYNLMLDWLIKHEDMTEEESADFICFNDSFYYGKGYPIVYYGEDYEDIMKEEDPEYEPLVFTRIEDLPDKYLD